MNAERTTAQKIGDKLGRKIGEKINKAVEKGVGAAVRYVKAGKHVSARTDAGGKAVRKAVVRQDNRIHNAAVRLGKLGAGVPKNITDDERDARRDRMESARESRW